MSEILKGNVKRALLAKGFNTQASEVANSYTFDVNGTTLASFEIWLYPAEATSALWNFNVDDDFEGNGIAKILLQEIAKFVQENNISEIELMLIRHDGVTFWPRMGALPPTYPNQRALQFYINQYASSDEDKKVLSDIMDAGHEEEDLWFALTDKHTGVSKPTLERINLGIVNHQMYLELARPVVQQRLEL